MIVLFYYFIFNIVRTFLSFDGTRLYKHSTFPIPRSTFHWCPFSSSFLKIKYEIVGRRYGSNRNLFVTAGEVEFITVFVSLMFLEMYYRISLSLRDEYPLHLLLSMPGSPVEDRN